MKLTLMKQQWLLAVAFSMIFAAQAEEHTVTQQTDANQQPVCPMAKAQDHNQQPIEFKQHRFDDGTQDLAVIAMGVQADKQQVLTTKRITYHQHKAAGCHFSAVAITRGGDWGWFLAWADREKIYYTRLDGEALVFVPPKKIPISQVTHIEFLSNTAQPTMRVQTQQGPMQQYISEDAGRNWQISPVR